MEKVQRRSPRRLVLTGGPGAGKTAVIELARRHFGHDLEVLTEAASVVFRGGFPRLNTTPAREAAQRAIFHVQRELENVAAEHVDAKAMLCDRGTVDCLAYWPGPWPTFWRDVGTTIEKEFSRYDAVIHLRSPTVHNGYHTDDVRIESAKEAHRIDERLRDIWSLHPRVFVVDSTATFWEKARQAIDLIGRELDVAGDRPLEAAPLRAIASTRA